MSGFMDVKPRPAGPTFTGQASMDVARVIFGVMAP
jgi:hypothetical protein